MSQNPVRGMIDNLLYSPSYARDYGAAQDQARAEREKKKAQLHDPINTILNFFSEISRVTGSSPPNKTINTAGGRG